MMLLRKIISVGIEGRLNSATIARWSSALTFTNRMSGLRAAAAAKLDANAREAALDGAQKSTIANGWPLMYGVNVSAVSSMTPGAPAAVGAGRPGSFCGDDAAIGAFAPAWCLFGFFMGFG